MEQDKNDVKKKQSDAKERQEIPKDVKKKRFHFERKQKIAVGVMSIIAVASIVGIVGGIMFYLNVPKGGDLIVGVDSGPESIDPIAAREWTGRAVLDQAAEGLFGVDINDQYVDYLATSGSWSSDNLEYTCTLRHGVRFHNGAEFNSQAVKWNLDRLYNLTMISQLEIAMWYNYMWVLPDGRWVINETQVIDEHTVKFVLNEPYAPFRGLLASRSAYIVSPTSTPKDEEIDLLTGDLVGTGPFIYESYEIDSEVRMLPNPNYWGGKPLVDELIFSIFFDEDAIVDAVLSGNIHIAAPGTEIVENFRERISANSSVKYTEAEVPYNGYIGMNNKKIPVEMRKAMAYAFDYDYLIEDHAENWVKKMKSPIPKGILYSNTEDFDVPVLNLTIARKSLQDANWSGTAGLPLDDDGPWEALVDNNTQIATYNFSSTGIGIYNTLLTLLQDNYKKIGVKIVNETVTGMEFFYRAYDMYGFHKNMLELYHVRWAAVFNDPCEFINPLMSNHGYEDNTSQINDTQLQTWMDQALIETDPTVREALYYQIQERFIEEIYPWVMLYSDFSVEIIRVNLRGYEITTSTYFKLVLKNAYFV